MANLAEFLDKLPILLVGLLMLATMMLTAATGYFLRRRVRLMLTHKGAKEEGGAEGYIVSAVIGLVALLLGFTFALAVGRFETRRALVLDEANAIGTAYLRVQGLPEPHRTRLSQILVNYTNNRVDLGAAKPDKAPPLVVTSDRLLVELWAGTLAATDTIGNSALASSLHSAMNDVIDMDSARKAARKVRVPGEVFLALWLYIAVTAGMLGYARSETQGRMLAGILFLLFTMSYMLIIDIDRPANGNIVESQGPMIDLRETLKQQPPGTFDTWRKPVATPAT
ncbi:hypothetical protein N6H05_21950 [Sphingobium sp. WTD-1]|jgi:hypothetical protein|uniref:bestrophin-like domain n=1 Tax=Sphingobium sp. WTD-1 TaxID=2979467 RepID=UPI0024DEA523|nr:hypothetical protein [Sphingobium sp. WTD-1]WIA55654.1 hypothetical protein N6H05_21950 [Sphingobium sp. WTD-1]